MIDWFRAFSPRPWGWSGGRGGHATGPFGFPTLVGMVRAPRTRLPHQTGFPRSWGWSWRVTIRIDPAGLSHACGNGPWRDKAGNMQEEFPHARGDGPYKAQTQTGFSMFSPRSWGWSVFRRQEKGRQGQVFPTLVGMVRRREPGGARQHRFSHARGDDPFGTGGGNVPLVFSPRSWGWSETTIGPLSARLVFPTTVGMVRRASRFWLLADCFPTTVGMVRTSSTCLAGGMSFPHARGDGPIDALQTLHPGVSPRSWGWSDDSADKPGVETVFPRSWGWSERGPLYGRILRVFPTLVGMVRAWTVIRSYSAGFPHARGDDSVIEVSLTPAQLFPHACGDGPGRSWLGSGFG